MDLNDQSILFEGLADLERTDQGGRIFDLKSEAYQGKWKVLEYGCILEHTTENNIRIFLSEKGHSKAVVDTEFGRLEIPGSLLTYTQNDQKIKVEYTLDGAESPFRFLLSVED